MTASALSLLLLFVSLAPQVADAQLPQVDERSEVANRISAFTLPLHLGELPPEVRTLRSIQLVHVDVPKVSAKVTRTRDEALELGAHLTALLRAGEDFNKLSREYSAAKNAGIGGVLGSFQPGVLMPAMNEFLFSAAVGDVSEPLVAESGVFVLQRVDTYAATRHLLVRGNGPDSEAKARELADRIRGGEDFGELATEHSDDPFSAPRGGLFTVFERGSNDRLLKKAAFEAAVGETVGPIKSSSGYHLIQRVPVEGHPRDLRETTQVRARAILISHNNTPLRTITADRPMQEAEVLATEIRDRIRSGEDMLELARRFNEDTGGKARAGDLGWVHRTNPRTAPFLKDLFRAEPGELVGPILTNVGYVVVRREL